MRVVEGSGFDLSLVAAGGTPLRIVNVWGDIGMLRKFVTVAISAAALGGCATIDNRRAEDPANVADQISGYDGTCAPSKADPKVVNTICYPLLGSKLFRKNTSSKIGIQEQDVYSVRLDHGHMRYVSEFPLRPGRVLDGKNPFRAQAEIVVLARAFEFGPVAKADLNALVTSTEPQAAAESRRDGWAAEFYAVFGSVRVVRACLGGAGIFGALTLWQVWSVWQTLPWAQLALGQGGMP